MSEKRTPTAAEFEAYYAKKKKEDARERRGLGEKPGTGVLGYDISVVPASIQVDAKRMGADFDPEEIRYLTKVAALRKANPALTFEQACDEVFRGEV